MKLLTPTDWIIKEDVTNAIDGLDSPSSNYIELWTRIAQTHRMWRDEGSTHPENISVAILDVPRNGATVKMRILAGSMKLGLRPFKLDREYFYEADGVMDMRVEDRSGVIWSPGKKVLVFDLIPVKP